MMSPNVVKPGTAQVHLGADFTEDETEFVMAMERYRRMKHRRFPSFREVLQVLKSLGYRKQETALGLAATRSGALLSEDSDQQLNGERLAG